MKSLFIKVFGLLLGGFIVVMAVSMLVFWWINNELHPDQERLQNQSVQIGNELVTGYQAGELTKVRNQLQKRFHVRIWLMDQNNRSLGGHRIPRYILKKIHSYPDVINPIHSRSGRSYILANEIVRGSETYRVVIATGRRPFRRDNHLLFIWIPIGALVLALAIGSVLLSLWVLRPLRAIRETAGAISGNNLAARVPQKITNRRDAFGELGNEFNSMTSRLERNITTQRQLLRDISHELRTPLSRMLIAASLSTRKHGQSEEITRIESEINRLDDLIGSLLTLSRLQDQWRLHKQPLQLDEVLEPVIEDARYEFQDSNKNVRLNLHHQGNIEGDPELLGRAVENILRNALRFSPDGGMVTLDTASAGDRIEIIIRDSGPGVGEEQLQSIFEPFFQADPSRNPGTEDNGVSQHGIGLTLSRTIVQLHGGSIRAGNIQGGGLEVVIRIPALA